jgi:hypothetical protein
MKTAHYPKSFLLLASILLLAAGCSVVKTPYFTTDYYKETVAGLEFVKSQTQTVNDSLYAGFSRISITPDLHSFGGKRHMGIPIAGFGQLKPKYATGVHDSVFVRALALKAGTQTVVLVSVDMLIMPPNLTDAVVKSLSENGVRREQLFFTAVHSHSSIGGWGYGPLAKIMAGKEDKELESWIVSNISKAVLQSISDLHRSSAGTGSFMAPQYTRNRLTGDEEQINNEFNFIAIEQEGGKKYLVGTYSAHSTSIGSKNTLISADYPGAWIRHIEDKTGNMAMFCGGSMGSQSPVGEGADFERAAYIGNALADSTLKHLKDMQLSAVVSTSSLSLRTELPEYHMRMSRNRNFTTVLSNSLMAQPENVYLQALRINNLIWFTTPGDFSGESALLIKNLMEAKGYEAVVSGYNGSYVGYIIPGKYFYLNNYEPKGMGWFGPTMGDYVTEMLLRMGNAVIPAR